MKRTVHLLGFILLTIVFMSTKCESGDSKFEENPTFKITEATYQEIIPGVQGQPIYYKLEIKFAEMPEDMVLDSLLFKDAVKAINPEMMDEQGTLYMNFYQKEVNLNLQGDLFDQTLLYYHQQDKNYFTVVKDLNEMPSMPMP